MKQVPLSLPCNFDVLTFCAEVNLTNGEHLQLSTTAEKDFRNIFGQELRYSTCLFTDGSKIRGVPFTGFTIVSLNGNIRKMYRAVGFLLFFCVETMAILEAVRIAREN